MLFTGRSEHTLDSTLRLAIPARFRNQWQPERDGNAWMCLPWPSGCLRLYTEGAFTVLSRRYGQTLGGDDAETAVDTMLFGMAERLEHDTAGRVMLPKHQIELAQMDAGPKSSVTLVGAGNRLEVWDTARWQKEERERFTKLPELLKRLSKTKNE